MARLQTNLSLTEDARIKLDQLVVSQRKTSGDESSRSQVVSTLIECAYANLKRIEPLRSGKKIVGWRAMYGDHTVGEFDLLDKPQAQKALDAYVYEELSK